MSWRYGRTVVPLVWLCAVGCRLPELRMRPERMAECERENVHLRAVNDRLAQQVKQARKEAEQASHGLARYKALNGEVEVEGSQARLQDAVTRALADTTAVVRMEGGRVVIRAREAFESGQSDLTAEGRALLARIGEVLAEHAAACDIAVAGHTDATQVRGGDATGAGTTNWELSAARALTAMRTLAERSGLDRARFHFRGYGEHHPIASNETAKGRAANRRVEIIVGPAR